MNVLLTLVLFLDPQQTTIIQGSLTVAASTEKKILVVRIGATDVRQDDIAVGTKSHPTPMGRYIGNAASHGYIRMTEADAVDLARYLMEHAGAHHDDDWYVTVQSSANPADVRLL